jgi:arsenite methyltransferase
MDTREAVRARYAAAATESTCCDASCCGTGEDFGAGLYDKTELVSVPQGAVSASLGCGNPTAVAELATGETVLDLGSGAGIDVLLSAQRVGPTGFAYGLDMTDEMLELARKHAAEAGATNVAFLRGFIEDIPLDDGAVDVVISNCVINLSSDKPAVFAEMHRVLKPGGRIGITDVVAEDQLSAEERLERGSWVGCIAGALSFEEYETGLAQAGFTDVTLTPTHAVADGMHSVIVRAIKPEPAVCEPRRRELERTA